MHPWLLLPSHAVGLSFSLCGGMLQTGGAVKKRQGVIWGKTSASFEGNAANVISRLADYVELHSTIEPKDAPLRRAIPSEI